MSNNEEEILKNLKAIKFLLAGILLNRNPNIKEIAKVAGCSDKTLTSLFPDKKKKTKNQLINKQANPEDSKGEINGKE